MRQIFSLSQLLYLRGFNYKNSGAAINGISGPAAELFDTFVNMAYYTYDAALPPPWWLIHYASEAFAIGFSKQSPTNCSAQQFHKAFQKH